MGDPALSQPQAKLDLLEALLAKLDAVWGIDNLVDVCVDEPGDHLLVLDHLIETARESDPRCLWSPTGEPDDPRCVLDKGHQGNHRDLDYHELTVDPAPRRVPGMMLSREGDAWIATDCQRDLNGQGSTPDEACASLERVRHATDILVARGFDGPTVPEERKGQAAPSVAGNAKATPGVDYVVDPEVMREVNP